MQLDSRRQGSAKDYVVQELIHDIVNIKLKPGEKLCEPALCERFGVSRTPFREAELELAQRKLIVVRPKIGTFVSFIDKELVEEVRHLRSVLEAELAVMACSMLTKKDIDRLWENVAVWEMYMQRGDYEKILQLDKSFHAMVYEMCGRTYWHELVESISPHFDRTTVLSLQCRPTDSILSVPGSGAAMQAFLPPGPPPSCHRRLPYISSGRQCRIPPPYAFPWYVSEFRRAVPKSR